jgi:hypothetical protein
MGRNLQILPLSAINHFSKALPFSLAMVYTKDLDSFEENLPYQSLNYKPEW